MTEEEEIIKNFYENTRKQIEHEDALINHRLTWLLMLQGFLFSAYGFSLSAEGAAKDNPEFIKIINNVREYLALMGFWSSLALLMGILAATFSLYSLVDKWKKHVGPIEIRNRYPQIIGNVKSIGMFWGLFPTLFLPLFACYLWYGIQPNIKSNVSFFTSGIFLEIAAIVIVLVAVFFVGRISGRISGREKKKA